MKIVKVDEALEFANTFYGDPILKMAINAVLNNMPAADAIEVVHGKWNPSMEEMKDDLGKTHLIQTGLECSVCGHYSCCSGNYCGHCGAKMDIIL